MFLAIILINLLIIPSTSSVSELIARVMNAIFFFMQIPMPRYTTWFVSVFVVGNLS